MRNIQMRVGFISPRAALSDMVSKAKVALRKFCTRKVIELKLAPKSFVFEFDFHDSRRQINKSVERLGVLIRRALIKRVPYLEHTKFPFVQTSNVNLTVRLDTPIEVINAKDFIDVRYQLKGRSLLSRYAKKLNYLFRKYKIPVGVTFNCSDRYCEGEQERAQKLLVKEMSKPENFIKVYSEVYFTFELGVWWCRDTEHLEVYSANDDWGFTSVTNMSTNHTERSVGYSSDGSRLSIETIFFYIPQCIKVLQTLSRKTQYAYSAFRIESAECPAD